MTEAAGRSGPDPDDAARRIARGVRDACVDAALAGHETAGLGGLCAEGRWEAAVEAIRSLDLDAIVSEVIGAPSA